MIEVYPSLFIGDMKDYETARDLSICSATQTIHYQYQGWKRGEDHSSDPNYLIYSRGKRMSLNWVDGSAYYYRLWDSEKLSEVTDWITGHLPCLIHCNAGESRSASLGLHYLAKCAGTISNDSFKAAKKDFIKLYPAYKPGGIADYLSTNWAFIL